jgi:5'-3' exonuclease
LQNLSEKRLIWQGCCWTGIDTSRYFHAWISASIIEINDDIGGNWIVDENALLTKILDLGTILATAGLVPLFVFDGVDPPGKAGVRAKRDKKKKDAEAKYIVATTPLERRKHFCEFGWFGTDFIPNVKEALNQLRYQWIHAPMEADSQLCYLFHTGEIFAILGNDGDYIWLGCRVIDSKLRRYYDPLEDSGAKVTSQENKDEETSDDDEEANDEQHKKRTAARKIDWMKVQEDFVVCRREGLLLCIPIVCGCDYIEGAKGWTVGKALPAICEFFKISGTTRSATTPPTPDVKMFQVSWGRLIDKLQLNLTEADCMRAQDCFLHQTVIDNGSDIHCFRRCFDPPHDSRSVGTRINSAVGTDSQLPSIPRQGLKASTKEETMACLASLRKEHWSVMACTNFLVNYEKISKASLKTKTESELREMVQTAFNATTTNNIQTVAERSEAIAVEVANIKLAHLTFLDTATKEKLQPVDDPHENCCLGRDTCSICDTTVVKFFTDADRSIDLANGLLKAAALFDFKWWRLNNGTEMIEAKVRSSVGRDESTVKVYNTFAIFSVVHHSLGGIGGGQGKVVGNISATYCECYAGNARCKHLGCLMLYAQKFSLLARVIMFPTFVCWFHHGM